MGLFPHSEMVGRNGAVSPFSNGADVVGWGLVGGWVGLGVRFDVRLW